MTAAEFVEETLPPIACAAWCEDGTGHINAWHPSDQWCYGERLELVMSRRPLVNYGEGFKRRDRLSSALQRDPHDEVIVSIVDDTENHELVLTANEARELGEQLIRLADVADGG